MMGFFDKALWQKLFVAVVSSIFTLCVAVFVSLYISGQIEKLTDLAKSTNEAMQTALKIIQVGPDGITDVGNALSDSIGTTGEKLGEVVGTDLGDGVAKAVDAVKGVLKGTK